MNILIIEDEALMAKDLAQSLQKLNPSIRILATLTSVQEAVEYFSEDHEVELIFSDIELEDGLSFEIFKQAKLEIPVIFCTAYDEYALNAFRANGVEYILKPYTNSSLQKALDKYQWLKETLHTQLSKQYETALAALSAYEAKKSATIMVRYRERILPIPVAQIACIYIENDMVYLYTLRQKSYVVPHTLDEMEKTVGQYFFRVNRQFLVNRQAVQEAAHAPNRKLAVTFKFPFEKEVLVSKEKTIKFLSWLGE